MPRIAHQELTELVTQTFTKAGTPQAHAEIVSTWWPRIWQAMIHTA